MCVCVCRGGSKDKRGGTGGYMGDKKDSGERCLTVVNPLQAL